MFACVSAVDVRAGRGIFGGWEMNWLEGADGIGRLTWWVGW